MRQQQNWQQANQANTNQQHQYIFSVEPSQDPNQQEELDPYITPPPAQPLNEQANKTPKNSTKEAGLIEAEDEEEAKAVDLRKAPKNCSATFMGQMLVT